MAETADSAYSTVLLTAYRKSGTEVAVSPPTPHCSPSASGTLLCTLYPRGPQGTTQLHYHSHRNGQPAQARPMQTVHTEEETWALKNNKGRDTEADDPTGWCALSPGPNSDKQPDLSY